MIFRSARTADAPAIAELVNGFAAEGVMLPRTAESVELAIESFVVACDERGGILACGALREYSPSLAEVSAIAVDASAHGRGLGSEIVRRVEQLARQRGIGELFALTLTAAFFESLGYSVVERARYPEKMRRDCTGCARRFTCGEICVRRDIEPACAGLTAAA
ncbi:MAG: GNAT family N-acetyltransferase [Gemmatimonadaceae bacterium]